MSRWFRVYDEIIDDPKVQLLSPELFKTWINVMALASRTKGRLPQVAQMAFSLRLSPSDMQSRLDDLVLAGLIDILPDKGMEPHNWSKRQWKSDDSADRVRKHREAKRQVAETERETADETERNEDVTVTVTPPDTESDTEKGKRDSRAKIESPIKCDPNGVTFDGTHIQLDPGNRAFWLDQFGGDGQRLDLALLQAEGFIQPNSSRPMAVQVGAQLARAAADKRDRDRRYEQAAKAKPPKSDDKPKARTLTEALRAARERAQSAQVA